MCNHRTVSMCYRSTRYGMGRVDRHMRSGMYKMEMGENQRQDGSLGITDRNIGTYAKEATDGVMVSQPKNNIFVLRLLFLQLPFYESVNMCKHFGATRTLPRRWMNATPKVMATEPKKILCKKQCDYTTLTSVARKRTKFKKEEWKSKQKVMNTSLLLDDYIGIVRFRYTAWLKARAVRSH